MVLSGVTNDDNWAGQSTLVGGGPTNSYNFGAGADGDPPIYGHQPSNAYLFFPDFEAKSYPIGAWQGVGINSDTNDNKWCVVFNHEVPFVGVYFCRGAGTVAVDTIIMTGDIIEPRDTADTREEGVFCWRCSTTQRPTGGATGLDGGINNFGSSPTAGRQVNCLDKDGNRIVQWGFHTNNAWTPLNQPRADGTFDLAPIRLYASVNQQLNGEEVEEAGNINKGFLKKDVIGHQGFYNTGPYMMFDARYGKAFQFSNSYVCPWVDTAPVPFFGWPIDPQDPQRK